MGHATNTGPLVCFERPERSPCLTGLEAKDPDAYHRALAIIEEGVRTLEARPRADMEGFVPAEEHLQKQQRYETRREIEMRNRAAIRAGENIGDPACCPQP